MASINAGQTNGHHENRACKFVCPCCLLHGPSSLHSGAHAPESSPLSKWTKLAEGYSLSGAHALCFIVILPPPPPPLPTLQAPFPGSGEDHHFSHRHPLATHVTQPRRRGFSVPSSAGSDSSNIAVAPTSLKATMGTAQPSSALSDPSCSTNMLSSRLRIQPQCVAYAAILPSPPRVIANVFEYTQGVCTIICCAGSIGCIGVSIAWRSVLFCWHR